MTYTYRVRSTQKHKGFGTPRAKRSLRGEWVLAGLAAALFLGLFIWITVSICGRTQVISGVADAQIPRNQLNMHGVQSSNIRLDPLPRM